MYDAHLLLLLLLCAPASLQSRAAAGCSNCYVGMDSTLCRWGCATKCRTLPPPNLACRQLWAAGTIIALPPMAAVPCSAETTQLYTKNNASASLIWLVEAVSRQSCVHLKCWSAGSSGSSALQLPRAIGSAWRARRWSPTLLLLATSASLVPSSTCSSHRLCIRASRVRLYLLMPAHRHERLCNNFCQSASTRSSSGSHPCSCSCVQLYVHCHP